MTGDQLADLEWGVALRPFPGEKQCGDNHLVMNTSYGWLLTVADGLGHGPEAADASKKFVETVQHYPDEQPVELMRRCHQALRSTRGSAATIVAVNRSRNLLGWVGVGNVEGVVRHGDAKASRMEYIAMRGGIVGYRLPELRSSFLHLENGDMLVLATDGIDGGFTQALTGQQPPAALAGLILEHFASSADDALVLVALWRSVSGIEEKGLS